MVGGLLGVGSLWPGRYGLRASPVVLLFLVSIFKPFEIHLKSSPTPDPFFWKIEHYKLRGFLTFPTWANYYHQLVIKNSSFRFIPALRYLTQTWCESRNFTYLIWLSYFIQIVGAVICLLLPLGTMGLFGQAINKGRKIAFKWH
jgi:hypothetical protein